MNRKILSITTASNWAMNLESFKALQRSVKMASDDSLGLDLKIEDPTYQVFNSVAIIPIKGVLSKNVSIIEKILFDVIDIDNISQMFSAANRDEDVDAIVLDISSPGGNVAGIAESYDQISASSKPVIAFTDETIASAAYWIASAASVIYATKSADLGSVGVFASFIDYSKAFEQQGLRAEVIVSTGSKFKGAGIMGTSLTDEQRDQIQGEVDYLNGMFLADINAKREIAKEDLAGQTFIGELALKSGYVDSIVGTIDAAIQDSLVLANKDFDINAESAATTYNCECIKCGYKVKSEKHCNTFKCAKCGGEMRREERPGPGR